MSVRGLPSVTRPGLLDALGALPFAYRWTARWIGLDKPEAELEIVKLRKRWFAKRKGVGVLLREAITKEEVPLLDTDAASKTEECDGALAALGAEACAFGYLTLTVTVLDATEAGAAANAKAEHDAQTAPHRGSVLAHRDPGAENDHRNDRCGLDHGPGDGLDHLLERPFPRHP